MSGLDDRLLDLCTGLVRVPSENPPGDTRAIVAHLDAVLRPLGADVRIVAGQPSMPNVVAIARGRQPGRRLVFNGHLDTFAVGDPTPWTVDPLGGVVKDGRVYGRGVSDMKGGLAAALFAFELLHEHREAWAGELVLTFASDEETMGRWGTAYLLENVPEARGDAMVCGDAGSPMVIRLGEKGLLWLRITAGGRAAHGAHVHLGDNAVERLLDALARLVTLRELPVPTPPAIAAAIDEAREVSERLAGPGETAVLTSVTVNIGTVKGGTSVNLVPARATAEVDVRLPVGVSIDAVVTEARRRVAGLSGVEIEVLRRFEPNYTDPRHEIFRRLQANAEALSGRRPVVTMRVGASDSRLYRMAGIPAAVYGPTPHNMGAPDEHITVDDLRLVGRVHALTAFDFLSSAG
jgi:acetylornithine deacetylase/succinyl-diaminopimelate desuccinylase-like protein